MLTWTSVVAEGPTDNDIAAAVACRQALVIRPLTDFAPLRRAMGLPVPGAVIAETAAAPAGTSGGRRRSTGTKATAAGATSRTTTRASAKSKPSAKPRHSAKPKQAPAARTPETAAA